MTEAGERFDPKQYELYMAYEPAKGVCAGENYGQVIYLGIDPKSRSPVIAIFQETVEGLVITPRAYGTLVPSQIGIPIKRYTLDEILDFIRIGYQMEKVEALISKAQEDIRQCGNYHNELTQK